MTKLADILGKTKEIQKKFLEKYLQEQKQALINVPWVDDVIDKLFTFSTAGKMARGSIIILTAEALGQKTDENILKTALAHELMQTGCLIQDDVMDQDPVRRGLKSTYIQYMEHFAKYKIKNSKQIGESLAMCVGDVCYFLAFKLLTLSTIKEEIKAKLYPLFAHEWAIVGFGQMKDIELASIKAPPSKKDVLSVLEYKSARYSIALPLQLGAMLAHASDQLASTLFSLGKDMGLIFQIKDDELGILGDSKLTGKPVGNDIREGKKTLFYHYLYQKSSELKKLNQIFGNQQASQEDIQFVLDEIKKHKIHDQITKEMNSLAKTIEQAINKLHHQEKLADFLKQLLEYNLGRSK